MSFKLTIIVVKIQANFILIYSSGVILLLALLKSIYMQAASIRFLIFNHFYLTKLHNRFDHIKVC